MQIVNIDHATSQLSSLIQKAIAGEVVCISKEDGATVQLTPILSKNVPRVGGQLRGQFKVADNFDEFDAELEDMFYNSKLFPNEES